MGLSVSLARPCTLCLSLLPVLHDDDNGGGDDNDDDDDDDDDVHTLAFLSVLLDYILIFCCHYQ